MAVIQERTTADGKMKYRALIRLKGYPPQSATFNRKTDARNWITQTEAAIREGRHFKTLEAKKHTVADLIDRYLKQEDFKEPKNKKDKRIHLNWWRNELGCRLLSDINPSMLVSCREKLLQGQTYKGTLRSPATVNRYLTTLSHALNLAIREWEWLEVNPVSRLKKSTESRGRVRFLDSDERERLLKSCRETRSPMLLPMVVLAISTGMRQGEILNIQWKDVDFERKMIIIHDTKNGERRVAPLYGLASEELLKLFKSKTSDSSFVFVSPNNDSKPINIRKSWDSAVKNARIEDFHFHDLRHTAASYLAMNGATLTEIAGVLGHKTLAMVKRYSHLSEAHTASVVERMNNKIFGEGIS